MPRLLVQTRARTKDVKSATLMVMARALKNVLPPRLGGALNLLERNERADIVFCAHTGLDGTVDLRDFLRGSLVGSVVRVRFWRIPFDGIPAGRARQIDWLFEQWSRVDVWVGSQYDNKARAQKA